MGQGKVGKRDLYGQMMTTAVNAGLAVMPKSKAAKLLAALQAYGDEPFVLAGKLHTDTMLAARVLKIEPGVMPPRANTRAVRVRYEEIVHAKPGEVPAWLSELGAEYGVAFPPYRRK